MPVALHHPPPDVPPPYLGDDGLSKRQWPRQASAIGKAQAEPFGLRPVVGGDLHQLAPCPLCHEPAGLVNHVQPTVFDNAMAPDMAGCGVHQPQGFHRCEVHGLNGDHDTPPGLHGRRLPARWRCLPGMPHLPHSAMSMRTLSGPCYVTFAWLGRWPRPDGPRLPAVSRGVSLVAPACSIRSVHASTASARKLLWCIPLQAAPCAPRAESSCFVQVQMVTCTSPSLR